MRNYYKAGVKINASMKNEIDMRGGVIDVYELNQIWIDNNKPKRMESPGWKGHLLSQMSERNFIVVLVLLSHSVAVLY
jgi:hypothetical protein